METRLRTNLMLTAVALAALAVSAFAQSKTRLRMVTIRKAVPCLNSPEPRLPNGKPSMAGTQGQVRRADVTAPRVAPGFIAELPFTEWGKHEWETYDPVSPSVLQRRCR